MLFYQKSALYDVDAPFSFVYPLFVVVAVYTFQVLFSMLKHQWMRWMSISLILVLFVGPIRWMFASHPNQYMYFNELVGGLDGAYNQYENDY